jgi:hypothetical protein
MSVSQVRLHISEGRQTGRQGGRTHRRRRGEREEGGGRRGERETPDPLLRQGSDRPDHAIYIGYIGLYYTNFHTAF